MSVDETRQVIERYWSDDGGDSTIFADDVVFTLMNTGEQHHGPRAIRQMLEEFYHGTFEATGEIRHKAFSDGYAVAEGFVVGKQIRDFVGTRGRGQAVRMPICVSYEVINGLLARGSIYVGTGFLPD
jgi:hypothetical protein